MRRRASCWPWRTRRWANAKRPSSCWRNGCRTSRRIPWRSTCWPAFRAPTYRSGRPTRSWKRCSTRFAESFDEKLGRLSYHAPQLVAAVLQDSGLPATKALDVLDAGCGTGLCGPLVAPYARSLEGVDLSAKMLEKAKGRGYDRLVKSELVAFLMETPARYDLIVSADTLVYFGALEGVLAAACSSAPARRHAGLQPGRRDRARANGFVPVDAARPVHAPAGLRRANVDEPWAWSRRSCTPSSGWSRARRWPGWWCAPRRAWKRCPMARVMEIATPLGR